MPKFLVVHAPFSTPISPEEAAPLLKRAAGSMTADAYWISSFCQANAEGKAVKAYCRWDGVSVEAVRSAVTKLIPEMPVEDVYPLVTLDSGDFR
ncbi:MAG: hypothetical protein ACFFD8_10670 [Candidatus Thorarchaeota archaeon]